MPDPIKRAHDGWVLQLEKADERVNYRMVDPGADQRCGNCRYYSASEMSCNLVEGSISANCGCDLWTAPMSGGMMWSEEGEHLFSVFVEAPKGFKELERWIPFLPKPGKYQHPLYGEISITSETNQAMVDSVRNQVYQEHIPLDAEHETKLSGAVAWIQGMRLNADGSADAYVEWNERGRSLVEGHAFKYISPEWFDEWKDPASGVVHKNVVAGGAITTRPFFKEKVLRALVASESGATIISKQEEPRVPENKDKDPKTYAEGSPELQAIIDAAKAEAKTAAEAETQAKIDAAVAEAKTAAEPAPKSGDETPKEFKDSKEFAEMSARLTAAETANTTLTTALTEVRNRERHQRFSELVSGRGGANDGGAWVGDAEKHVVFLESLADKVGETDPMFTAFVENQNAIAAQSKLSNLFAEAGTAAPQGGTDADSRLEAMTQAKMATDPALTHAKAYNEVLKTPEGAQIYQAGEAAKIAKRA